MVVIIKSVILLTVILLSVTVLFATSATFVTSAYGHFTPEDSEHIVQHYDELNDKLMWKLGGTIQEGDLYQYIICSDKTISQIIYPYHCYNIELEFVTILESYNGEVWVVQGNFTTPDINRSMILLIDPTTFKVTTDKLNIDLGNSLENTIFSLSQYGEKSLSIGAVWGMVPSYFTNDVPLEIKKQKLIDTKLGVIDSKILGYDVIVQSNYYLSENYPFPVKASIFSPNIIFPESVVEYWFELEEYSNEITPVQFEEEYESREYFEVTPVPVPVPTFEVRPK